MLPRAGSWILDVHGNVDGLPMHFVEVNGENAAAPCTKGSLTSYGAEVITSFGLIPLLSVKARDAVRSVVDFYLFRNHKNGYWAVGETEQRR